MQVKKILLLFFFLAGWSCTSKPQVGFPKFTISTLSPDNGLSQGSNYFRFEDSKGFMWITGNDALNRYDGHSCKVYNLNKYFNNCPNIQQGYGFTEDAESNIYMGSTKGLYIYHRNKDKFTLQKIFTDNTDEIAMPFGFKDGKVWCFNLKFQLATYDVNTHAVEYIAQFNLQPLQSAHIYQLEGNVFYYHFPFIDIQGNCWLIGNKNIARYNTLSKTVSYPLDKYLIQNNTSIYSSTYDSVANNLLLGTQNGIVQYNLPANTIKEVRTIDGKKAGNIALLSAGKDFIALKNDDGMAFISKDYSSRLWTDYATKNYWRSYDYGFDKSGRFWFCNDGAGQVIVDFNPLLLNRETGKNALFFEAAQIATSGTGTFAELPNGDILIQQRIVQSRQTRNLYPLPIRFSDSIFSRNATDPYKKGIWFVNYINNQKLLTRIYFLNNENKVINYFTESHNDSLGQHQDIQVLPDGRVMCSYSNGIFFLDQEKKALTRVYNFIQKNPFKINLLSHGKIAVSYLNNDMLLSKVLRGGNVSVVNRVLPGVQSFYMQEDSILQQYWVGTNKGVYLLDRHFKTLKLFDANNGLAGTYIYGILLDDEGNAWCSHQHGLSSINAKTYQVINYDKSDGIQDWDFNNRAFYKAADGTLFFGGISGFNYFKPPLQHVSFYKPEVYIDEITVNNKVYLADTNANLIQKINLPYNENDIAIRAVVKDLSNRGMQQLVYRIKNTEGQWKTLFNNNVISFSSLAPGSYIIELGTYDKYSNRAVLQKTLSINIATPFYLKTWFWAFAGIISTAIVLGLLYRRRLIKQKAMFDRQLALEQQRNKITADLHDDIGASLSSLQVNSAVAFQLISHDDSTKAKALIEKIELQSQHLADKIGDIIWSMKPGKDEFMTLSTRIRNFANDILGATNINYKIEIDPTADSLIKDISVRKNIVLITKEAVNNAVKYSEAKNLLIKLYTGNQQIKLTVTDDGIGISNAFNKGNGLTNMRKRTGELNGTFNIITSPASGTSIQVTLPLVP